MDQELRRELEWLRARVAVLEQVDAERQAIAIDNARLFRVGEVEHASVQGLGIGLYLARSLVEAHGGRISAISTPGHGSTITISLPLQA